jgi:Flp pilus assembly protein TadG
MRRRFARRGPAGQALVEFALVFPMFALVLFAILVLGLGVFYQQQLNNATREAARYASIHSATAQCPTTSTLDPVQNVPTSYYRCDPARSWPRMTATARHAAWGLDTTAINISACWSGWVTQPPAAGSAPVAGSYDAPPPGTYDIAGTSTTFATTWAPCSIGGIADPQDNASQIACGPSLPTVDTASDQSDRPGVVVANTVTVYACFVWSPPMAGFLLIPATVTQTAVITEPIERQQ